MPGYRTWTDDDYLNGDDINDYLIGQVVCRFASANARDEQLGDPDDGQICYVAGVGHQKYENGAWFSLVTGAVSTPAVTITGGTAATAASTTPTIAGTAAVPDNSTITVTVGGRIYAALVSGSAWSCSITNALTNGMTFPVIASATASNGGTGRAYQALTITA